MLIFKNISDIASLLKDLSGSKHIKSLTLRIKGLDMPFSPVMDLYELKNFRESIPELNSVEEVKLITEELPSIVTVQILLAFSKAKSISIRALRDVHALIDQRDALGIIVNLTRFQQLTHFKIHASFYIDSFEILKSMKIQSCEVTSY